MNELHEDLDRALRAVTFGEAPVERTRRDGRRLRTRRRVAVVAGAVAVAVVAVGVPVLGRGIAAPPPAPVTHQDPVVTDSPPPGTTRAPGGFASASGVVAQGKVGNIRWRVTIHPDNTSDNESCYDVTLNGSVTSPVVGRCAVVLPTLQGGDPAEFGATDEGPAGAELGVAAANVTYFVVTFTDGQQLKLIPVTVGGHRYVAWAAPASMTVTSVVAHLGTPYADGGQTETAVPFDPPGMMPGVGLWQKPGQAAPPRASGVIGAGRTGGRPWSSTAYEGPWGTCFVLDPQTTECLSVSRLGTTAVLGGWGGNPPGPAFGSAAPGVAQVAIVLSDGTLIRVKPVTIGNERLFAFPLSAGVSPVSWSAYAADGQQTGTGSVASGTGSVALGTGPARPSAGR